MHLTIRDTVTEKLLPRLSEVKVTGWTDIFHVHSFFSNGNPFID